MKPVKTLLISTCSFMSAVIWGLLSQDPFISPEFTSYDDLDKHKGYNVIVLDDDSVIHNKQEDFLLRITVYNPGNCLLYTCSTDRKYLSSFLTNGIGGIVSHASGIDELRKGILIIAGGSNFYCKNIKMLLLDKNERYTDIVSKILTVREKELLRLIKSGKTNKEISEQLFLSAKTVNRHKENLKNKLSLRHTSELYSI